MKTRSPLPPWITWLTGFFFLVTHAVSQAVVQRNTITTGNNPVGYDKGYIVLDGAYLAFQDMNTVPLYQNIRVNKGGALYYINNNLEGFNINSAHAFLSTLFSKMMVQLSLMTERVHLLVISRFMMVVLLIQVA